MSDPASDLASLVVRLTGEIAFLRRLIEKNGSPNLKRLARRGTPWIDYEAVLKSLPEIDP